MYMQNSKNNYRQMPSGTTKIKQPLIYYEFIKKHLGRKIKVEYITNNAVNELYGQLINVGADFIVIKLPGTPLSTVVFKNDRINKIVIIFEEN